MSENRDPPFRFRLFGDFRLVDDASGIDHTPRSRKACALLAHLAIAPDHRATRDRLIGLLWSDRGEDQARASLRQILTELRTQPFAPFLAMERREVRLADGGFTSDVDQILAFAASGDLPALAKLLSGISGTALDGLEGLDGCFDDWLFIERQRQQSRIVQDVLIAVERGTTANLLDVRRDILVSLQRIDTGDEHIARLGMALDQQAGDHAALHRRYRQLEAGLKRDLDAPVSADTQSLFRQLTTVGPVVAIDPSDPPASVQSTMPQRRVEPPILVVSPFALIGDGGDGALLAQVCHDDLQTALGSLRDLRLLSLQDPSRERLQAASASSIASYALDGAVRADGDGWRINLRLTGIDSGLLVWTRQLVVRQTDLLPAIDDLVARIAGAILPVVERDVGRILESVDHGAPAAYPLYFAARARLLSATSLADVREAASLLEQSIEHDPNLTNAYLHLARLYNTDFMQLMAGHDPAPLRARAFELCTRAVALEPGNGNVHSRLGWCYLRRGDARQAERKFATALELTPFHADGLNEIGFGLSHLGALGQARTLIARAFEYNPFPPDEYFSDLAVLLALAGEHDAAEAQFEISLNPSIHYLAVRAANLAMLGREQAARSAADELRKGFALIWQKPGAASDGEIVAVMMQFLPLLGESERGLFLEGLGKAGFGFDQRSTMAA